MAAMVASPRDPDGRKRKCGLELAPGGCFLGASIRQLYQTWTVTLRIGIHSGTLPFTASAAPFYKPAAVPKSSI
ncbi:hypothetical protein H671_6g16817 [Cricetulus griseus]|nr:hypothetical protein H671_6g16817 [Cricetulus griseus]